MSDASHAAIPETRLLLRNLDTGQTRESRSNSSGAFTFATLAPGRYSVTAIHQGSKSSVASNIVIQETHIFSPSVVSTLKLGFNRDVLANSNETADSGIAIKLGVVSSTGTAREIQFALKFLF